MEMSRQDDQSTPLLSEDILAASQSTAKHEEEEEEEEDDTLDAPQPPPEGKHINPLLLRPMIQAANNFKKKKEADLNTSLSAVSHDSDVTKKEGRKVEITVGDLVKYLTKDVHKKRHKKALPLYLFFLAMFTLLLVLERIDGESSMIFFRDLGTRIQLHAAPEAYLSSESPEQSKFTGIKNYDDYYAWLEAAVERIWPAGSLNANLDNSTPPGMTWTGREAEPADPLRINIPLAFILLRQFRVNGVLCDFGEQIKAIPETMRADMNISATTCFPSFSNDDLSIDPYSHFGGPNWTSNVHAPTGTFVNSIPRTGVVHSYDSPTKAFTVLLEVNKAFNNDIRQQIANLKSQKWIDEATRAMFVEVVTYNQADGGFVFTSLLVERLATNNYVPSSQSIPFHHLTLWSTMRYVILILDCISITYVIYDFCSFVYILKSDRDLFPPAGFSGVGVWGFFQCVMLGQFLAAYYYRARLYYESWTISDNYFSENQWQILEDFTQVAGATPTPAELEKGQNLWMWWKLAEYAYLYGQWSTLIAGCAIFSWLRLFSFLQYNEKLNILTETINVAVGDLVGVILLGAIVVVGFAISAHVLYGDDLEDFRHLRHSIGTLLRTLVSGEMPQYTAMLELHRWETRALVLSYYLLVWLILLNMILAIITGSFSSVQEGMQGQGNWTLTDVLATIKHWFEKKILVCKKKPVEPLPVEQESDSGISGTTARTQKMQSEQYLQNRIKAVQLLRENETNGAFRETGRGEGEGGSFIAKEDFYLKVCQDGSVPLSLHSVNKIFDKASKEVSATNRSIQQGEKWAQGITENLRKVTDLGPTTTKIQENTKKIDTALKIEKEISGKLGAVFEKLDEFRTVTDKLKNDLDSAVGMADPLPRFHDQMRSLKDSMSTAGPNTVQIMRQLHKETLELRPSLLKIERGLNRWTGKLMEDIKRGTLWGPPTAAASTRAVPRLERKEKGKGLVDNVSSYAFPQHYPAEDDPDTEDEYGVKSVFFGGEELDLLDTKPKADPVATMAKASEAPPRSILKSLTKLKQRSTTINPHDL
eukprot:TRINITY_DN6527_c0_g1_i1.p1 TRINITY_DN6527_c0_g1~~TRINITY_DN6527_c0_g1_i1.p1  ORF type:complete len:1045 (+),score=296.13 TRINITY_DN6527_c0_g1_i1:52-3186(+)